MTMKTHRSGGPLFHDTGIHLLVSWFKEILSSKATENKATSVVDLLTGDLHNVRHIIRRYAALKHT